MTPQTDTSPMDPLRFHMEMEAIYTYLDKDCLELERLTQVVNLMGECLRSAGYRDGVDSYVANESSDRFYSEKYGYDCTE